MQNYVNMIQLRMNKLTKYWQDTHIVQYQQEIQNFEEAGKEAKMTIK